MNVDAIAVETAAEEAVSRFKIAAVTKDDFTEIDVKNLKRSMSLAALSVPSSHDGGKVGHVGLVLSEDGRSALLNDTSAKFTPTPPPRKDGPDIGDNDTPAQVAKATAEWNKSHAEHHTERGCEEGLKKAIVDNAPSSALLELMRETHGLANETVKTLLAHLEANCTPADCVDVDELLTERDEPVDFDSEESVKVCFTNLQHLMKKLAKLDVTTSESELMMRLLKQFKQHGDFKDEVTEWESNTHSLS